MTEALILGTLLGIFSGTIPGPFTALIAASALRGGFWAGFRIGIVPLATETVVMTITALVLSQLPEVVLRWLGIVGGLFIFYLALRTWREADQPPEAEPMVGSARQMLEGSVLALLSPTPWAFWLLVGGPLFLAAWNDGWATGLAFYGSFLLFLVGAYLTIAGLAAYGQKRLSETWHRRAMRATAAGLLVAAVVLVWQSWIGNFEQMVQGSRTLETIVTDSILGES